MIQFISIELTNACQKECWFCYNHSQSSGQTAWTPDEVLSLIQDCVQHQVKAVSFGGGEPLQYPALFDLLKTLQGRLFISLTTNGLLLNETILKQLALFPPNKIHLSIHFPERSSEVERVLRQVKEIEHYGIRSGINFLVARSRLRCAIQVAQYIRSCGISNERIVYLPMRVQDTPTPEEMAQVAGEKKFQSMSCLLQCGKSPRFCSISWDKQVAWCSYTTSRRPLLALNYSTLIKTLAPLPVEFCGGIENV